VIEATGLTKRYRNTLAVDGLSFAVRPGQVTGFLGPNGSGKSTTMRMIMGLDFPTSGEVRVNGKPYRGLAWPLREVGALLEARSIHPGRSAYNHLLFLAQANGLPRRRVTEVLGLVGLEAVGGKRVGKFSLGMGQRLGIAAALLGDPSVLVFDEPINGLDPDGIRWVRNLLKGLAAEGRAVFVSSHLMSEMALTADHLVVIGRGKMIADMSMADFLAQSSRRSVRVRSPDAAELEKELSAAGAGVVADPSGALLVTGMDAAAIGDLCRARGLGLHELTPQVASLEEAFMELTGDSVEYHNLSLAQPGGPRRPPPPPPPPPLQGAPRGPGAKPPPPAPMPPVPAPPAPTAGTGTTAAPPPAPSERAPIPPSADLSAAPRWPLPQAHERAIPGRTRYDLA
jgi:ABC-2 type transport system ATP-binding protein